MDSISDMSLGAKAVQLIVNNAGFEWPPVYLVTDVFLHDNKIDRTTYGSLQSVMQPIRMVSEKKSVLGLVDGSFSKKMKKKRKLPDGFVTPVASGKKTKHLSVQRPRAKAVSTSTRMKKTRSRKFHQPSRIMPQLQRSLASLGRMLDRRVNESDKSYTNRLLLACEVEDQRQGELFDQRLKSNNDLKVKVQREDLVPYQWSSKFMEWTLINKD